MKYGLTDAGLLGMLAGQGDRCLVCSIPLTLDTAVVDHDHACCPPKRSCGKCVRGALCRNCNLGLGYFKDRPDVLRQAIAYLGGD